MSDWQVGDKAVCIESGRKSRQGVVYTVRTILPAGQIDPEDGRSASVTCLRFFEINHAFGMWCDHRRFRKILSDKHEPCEEEFVTLLNRKRVKA